MSVCTYDNPTTMNRECWQDGKMICHYAFNLLPPFAREPIPANLFFFGANTGEWEMGKLVGDAEAMSSNEQRDNGLATHENRKHYHYYERKSSILSGE